MVRLLSPLIHTCIWLSALSAGSSAARRDRDAALIARSISGGGGGSQASSESSGVKLSPETLDQHRQLARPDEVYRPPSDVRPDTLHEPSLRDAGRPTPEGSRSPVTIRRHSSSLRESDQPTRAEATVATTSKFRGSEIKSRKPKDDSGTPVTIHHSSIDNSNWRQLKEFPFSRRLQKELLVGPSPLARIRQPPPQKSALSQLSMQSHASSSSQTSEKSSTSHQSEKSFPSPLRVFKKGPSRILGKQGDLEIDMQKTKGLRGIAEKMRDTSPKAHDSPLKTHESPPKEHTEDPPVVVQGTRDLRKYVKAVKPPPNAPLERIEEVDSDASKTFPFVESRETSRGLSSSKGSKGSGWVNIKDPNRFFASQSHSDTHEMTLSPSTSQRSESPPPNQGREAELQRSTSRRGSRQLDGGPAQSSSHHRDQGAPRSGGHSLDHDPTEEQLEKSPEKTPRGLGGRPRRLRKRSASAYLDRSYTAGEARDLVRRSTSQENGRTAENGYRPQPPHASDGKSKSRSSEDGQFHDASPGSTHQYNPLYTMSAQSTDAPALNRISNPQSRLPTQRQSSAQHQGSIQEVRPQRPIGVEKSPFENDAIGGAKMTRFEEGKRPRIDLPGLHQYVYNKQMDAYTKNNAEEIKKYKTTPSILAANEHLPPDTGVKHGYFLRGDQKLGSMSWSEMIDRRSSLASQHGHPSAKDASMLSLHSSVKTEGSSLVRSEVLPHQRKLMEDHPNFWSAALAQPRNERDKQDLAARTGQGKDRHKHRNGPFDPNDGVYHDWRQDDQPGHPDKPYNPKVHGVITTRHYNSPQGKIERKIARANGRDARKSGPKHSSPAGPKSGEYVAEMRRFNDMEQQKMGGRQRAIKGVAGTAIGVGVVGAAVGFTALGDKLGMQHPAPSIRDQLHGHQSQPPGNQGVIAPSPSPTPGGGPQKRDLAALERQGRWIGTHWSA